MTGDRRCARVERFTNVLPFLQVSGGINWQAWEHVEAGVDKEVGAVYVDDGRVGGKPGNDGVDFNALHLVILCVFELTILGS
jgi:hypothetical protein